MASNFPIYLNFKLILRGVDFFLQARANVQYVRCRTWAVLTYIKS